MIQKLSSLLRNASPSSGYATIHHCTILQKIVENDCYFILNLNAYKVQISFLSYKNISILLYGGNLVLLYGHEKGLMLVQKKGFSHLNYLHLGTGEDSTQFHSGIGVQNLELEPCIELQRELEKSFFCSKLKCVQ